MFARAASARERVAASRRHLAHRELRTPTRPAATRPGSIRDRAQVPVPAPPNSVARMRNVSDAQPVSDRFIQTLRPLSDAERKDQDWQFAPIGCVSKPERAALNAAKVYEWARVHGVRHDPARELGRRGELQVLGERPPRADEADVAERGALHAARLVMSMC